VKHPIARGLTLVALLTCLMVPIAHAKKQPESWDGLTLKKVKGLDAVYVRPDVVFTAYKSVMLDQVQVEFAKNWQRDIHSNSTGFKSKPTAEDMQEIKDGLEAQFPTGAADRRLANRWRPDVNHQRNMIAMRKPFTR